MSDAKMRYRSLGRCGTKVSEFGLGGWTTYGESVTDEGVVRDILTTAFDAGVNFFDTADIYATGHTERVMGKVLRGFPRHELVISSKVFFPMSDDVNDGGLSRKHIMESIDKSLERIGVDYLDIYFCHRFDPATPIEETARAMDDLVHQGKVLYWGTSEWTGDQLREVHRICDHRNLYPPQVEQPQYSLLDRARLEQDVRPAALETGMGLVTWSPLAFGILTGKYDEVMPPGSRFDRIEWLRDKYYTEDRISAARRFRAQADEVGCSRVQLALAWAAAQPGISSVILGATTVEQLRENLAALPIEVPEKLQADLERIFPATGEPPC